MEDRRYISNEMPHRPVDWEALKMQCPICNRQKDNEDDGVCHDCRHNRMMTRI